MRYEIPKDQKFSQERMDFVIYLTASRILLRFREKIEEIYSVNVEDESDEIDEDEIYEINQIITKYKGQLNSSEPRYLNYKKLILSKFGNSGVETVLAIALSPAMKRSKTVADSTKTPHQDRLDALDDEYVDACASLAKWEYDARHFKHIRRVAYITAFVLSVSSVISAIGLLSK